MASSKRLVPKQSRAKRSPCCCGAGSPSRGSGARDARALRTNVMTSHSGPVAPAFGGRCGI
eukprot:3220241-Prymnesium_polylepis.1